MRVAMLLHPSIHLNLEVCGGIERRVLATMDCLAKRGVESQLWVSSLTGERDDVHVIRDNGWRGPLTQWAYYVRFWNATRGFDILHGHYTPALAVISSTIAVVHLAGLSVCRIPFYGICRNRAHQAHFVANAHHIAAKFADIYPELPRSHLHVIHNGADTTTFWPESRKVTNGLVHFEFHSLWEEPKGIFDLLQAVELLEKRRKDFCVHLAGSALFEGGGAERLADQARVEEWVSRLSTVKIVGELSHPALAEHLRHMDVGVFPSNHEEPFGNAVVEMMATGLPVIAFDIGGPREIIEHGKTGLLVENRNVTALAAAMERLIEDAALRKRMGQAARKRVEEYFNWDRHVDQLLEIYEQIVKRNRDRKR